MAAKTAGKKQKFSIGIAVIYVLITLLALICLYPFLNVLACSLSGYNPVLSHTLYHQEGGNHAAAEIHGEQNKTSFFRFLWR